MCAVFVAFRRIRLKYNQPWFSKSQTLNPTPNIQSATPNTQHPARYDQHATTNTQHPTRHPQHKNTQRSTPNIQHLLHPTSRAQQAILNLYKPRNTKHANVKYATRPISKLAVCCKMLDNKSGWVWRTFTCTGIRGTRYIISATNTCIMYNTKRYTTVAV